MHIKKVGVDIGKKTLSFCVITETQEGVLVDVNEWVSLNLIEENLHKCCGILRNKNKCTASPKFYHTHDNTTQYYCATHKKQHTQIEDVTISKYTGDIKKKCSHVSLKNINCKNNANCMVGESIYCKTHSEQVSKKITKNNSLQPFKKTICSDVPPQILCERIFNNLDKYTILKECIEVRIENQPGFITPEMKAVAAMVFAYFVALNRTYNINAKIFYVSPGSKIEYTEKFINFMNNKINQHKENKRPVCKCDICKIEQELINNKTQHNLEYSKYYFDHDLVKMVGVFYTEYVLIENGMGHLFELLSKYSKKDDPCDAFLHAYKKKKKK